jgi:hypothetical protein
MRTASGCSLGRNELGYPARSHQNLQNAPDHKKYMSYTHSQAFTNNTRQKEAGLPQMAFPSNDPPKRHLRGVFPVQQFRGLDMSILWHPVWYPSVGCATSLWRLRGTAGNLARYVSISPASCSVCHPMAMFF